MIADRIQAELDTDHVVVLVNPLLIEMGAHRDCDVVVVISADPETQVARTVARGMDEADVRARLAAQLPIEERARAADVLLDNEEHPRGSRGRGRGPVGVAGGTRGRRLAAPVSSCACPFARSCSMPGRRSSTLHRRSPSCSRTCSPARDTAAIPTRCSRPRAACSTGSPRPHGTTTCGRPARSDPNGSGRASTPRCSRSSTSASTSPCATSYTRPSPTPRTTRCSTTCSRRSAHSRPTGSPSASCRTSRRGSRICSARSGSSTGSPCVSSAVWRASRSRTRASSRLRSQRIGADAADAVYVGDNPEFDVEPARAVGMMPVLIDRRGRFPDVDCVRITDLRHLAAAVAGA